MLKIRVKHGDHVYINNKKFSIQVPSSKMCIVSAENEKHVIKPHDSTPIEGIDVSFSDFDKGYVRLGFSGNDNVRVESENLWRKRNVRSCMREIMSKVSTDDLEEIYERELEEIRKSNKQ